MKIVFDARVLHPQTHGISRYCRHLLENLLTLDRENEYRVLTRFPGVKDWFTPLARVSWQPAPVPPYSLREQWVVPWLLRSETFDLYVSPTYTLPRALAAKGILTIHDLIHLAFPEDYGWKHRGYYRLLVKPSVDRCRRVFTVSSSSKRDIGQYFHCPPEKIVLTPNGLDPQWFARPSNSEFIRRHGLESGYILFVGNPRPHKNFPRVLEAFHQLTREGGFVGKLAVVGLSPEDLPSGSSQYLKVFPYCSDPELASLYAGARLLAAPSLYEGFGLPVLEAMACGCPVLISDRASLPEIAGPAGWPVDPEQTPAIAEGMKRILSDPVLRERRKAEGLARARLYSWEETARTVLEVFRDLSGSR